MDKCYRKTIWALHSCKSWLHIHYWNVVVWFIFPQFCKSEMARYGYLKVFQRVPWTEVMRVDCISSYIFWPSSSYVHRVVRYGEGVVYLMSPGFQLILAYSWARPFILVAGKGRGGMFLFLLFLHFIPVPLSCLSLCFISSTISSISFLPFSGRWHKMTHKGWCVA